MTFMDDILSELHKAEKDGGVVRRINVRSTTHEEQDTSVEPPRIRARAKKPPQTLQDDDETT